MTWRKQDCDFWNNGKIVLAVRRHGLAAGVLAQILLDVNHAKDREGILSLAESDPEFLAGRIGSLAKQLETEVSDLLDGLVAVDFLAQEEDGRLRIVGWDQDEWGVRSAGARADLQERECEECGKGFQPDRETHVHCSKRCRQAASRRRRRSDDAGATHGERSDDAATQRTEQTRQTRPDQKYIPPPATHQPSNPSTDDPGTRTATAAVGDLIGEVGRSVRSAGVPPSGLAGILSGWGIGSSKEQCEAIAQRFQAQGGGRDEATLLWRYCQREARRNPQGLWKRLAEDSGKWAAIVDRERAA